MNLIISSYKQNGKSVGIYNGSSSSLLDNSYLDIKAPSFIIRNNEDIYTFGKDDGLKVYSYKLDGFKVKETSQIDLPGSGVTHLVYSKKNNLLFGCSYGDGSYFSIKEDNGKLLEVLEYKRLITDDRLSRAHCVLLNKDETKLLVVNISLDKIFIYNILADKTTFEGIIKLPEGVGPRHAIFNKDNSLLYVMTEYSNEVIVIDYKNGEVIQAISTIPNYHDQSFGATLFLSLDEKYLYASNRGEDSIARFAVLENGKLKYLNTFTVGGIHPRHMILSKDGTKIVSANKDSGNVTIIDLESFKILKDIKFPEASGLVEID